MNRRIELAKKKRTDKALERSLSKKNIKASVELKDAVDRLNKLLNGKQDYDFTRLEKQLTKIDKHLDLSQYFTNLERSIENNSPLTHISKTKIQDFSKLLEAVKNNKPIETKIDLNKLEKAVVNIEQYIRENTEASDQGAEKYKPYRRVVKVGNRFMFDDILTFAGGGGGGGQTNGLTDTELRATPVPVSGTVTATPTGTQNVDVTANTIGLATAANQLPDGHNVTVDNGIGAAAVPIQDGGNSITVDGTVAATQSGTWTEANSAAIKTAVETIDNAISGSEMQVDVVAALPAGTNNIGDVDVLSLPALPAGTNAIGKLSANSGVDIGDVDVTSSVSSTLDHGSNLDIDTTAEQITSTSFAAKFGVTVKSAVDNTATVYIGNSDVTDGDTAATDGFPLEPGESITLPVTNSNLLYAIAASANQKVFWIGV